MAFASNVSHLQAGRFIAGLGAGSAIVVVPLYLNEISPPDLRGMLGFMNQFSINIGILLAQFLGLAYSNFAQWRYILFGGAMIASLDAVLLYFIPESPKWLVSAGRVEEGRRALQVLRYSVDVEDEFSVYANEEEEEGLLGNHENITQARTPNQVSIVKFCTENTHRSKFIAVAGVMAFQQLCGVNSIIFYGVSVLATLFPQLAPVLNCVISILNCVVTAYSSTIVDKYGRKLLLISSIAGMTVTSALLGFGITHSFPTLSAVSAMMFVVSFAMGLGPIPFMVISELVPETSVGAAQSVGTTINWLATFLVVSIS
jgi:MFS family permease